MKSLNLKTFYTSFAKTTVDGTLCALHRIAEDLAAQDYRGIVVLSPCAGPHRRHPHAFFTTPKEKDPVADTLCIRSAIAKGLAIKESAPFLCGWELGQWSHDDWPRTPCMRTMWKLALGGAAPARTMMVPVGQPSAEVQKMLDSRVIMFHVKADGWHTVQRAQ